MRLILVSLVSNLIYQLMLAKRGIVKTQSALLAFLNRISVIAAKTQRHSFLVKGNAFMCNI